jgi:hypothetical protein
VDSLYGFPGSGKAWRNSAAWSVLYQASEECPPNRARLIVSFDAGYGNAFVERIAGDVAAEHYGMHLTWEPSKFVDRMAWIGIEKHKVRQHDQRRRVPGVSFCQIDGLSKTRQQLAGAVDTSWYPQAAAQTPQPRPGERDGRYVGTTRTVEVKHCGQLVPSASSGHRCQGTLHL